MTDLERHNGAYEPPRLLRPAVPGDALAEECNPGRHAAGNCMGSGGSATFPRARQGTGTTAFGSCTESGGAPTSGGRFSNATYNIRPDLARFATG